MPETQQRNLFVVVKRALRQPVAVAVMSAGVLSALALHDLTGLLVLAGTAAASAVYAVLKLQDEEFVRESIRGDRLRRRGVDRMARTFRIEELDVEARVKMKTIVRLQSEIAEDVAGSPIDEVAVGLADTVDRGEALVERGLAMAQKRRGLERYLARTDKRAIETRIRNLEERSAEAPDPVAKSEIEMSLASKKRELADCQAIEQASGRVLDQLDGIECAFASLRAKLVRIKSTDIDEWVAANQELQTELSSLNSAVDVVEESINEALTIGGQGV